MAKDPAFLFYPGDWLGGTIGMSLEEKGAYLELLVFQFNRGKFSEKQAVNLVRENWQFLRHKFKTEDGYFWNQKLADEQKKRSDFTESRRQSRLKSDEDNVRIYIVRDNVRRTHKIGSSVNPLRRYNELSNQANPAIMGDEQGKRDISLVWYSIPTLRTEEKKLHKEFIEKHITGEWFLLDQTDLAKIFSTYEGTYVERTENEDENITVLKKESNGTWEMEKRLFLNAEQWQYKQVSEYRISKDALLGYINVFLNRIELAEDYKSEKDLKRHCANWLRKNISADKTKALEEKRILPENYWTD